MVKKNKAPAKILALDWDNSHMRVALGKVSGDSIQLLRAETISRYDDSANDDESAELKRQPVDKLLSGWVESNGLTGSEVLVAVPRTDVELRLLDVPPAPPDELPDIVRFQAQQAFTSLEDSWPLDYILIVSIGGETKQVLAATLTDKRLRSISRICEKAALKLRGVVLRSSATAALVRRNGLVPTGRFVLVAETAESTVDLAVISNESVLLTRSARLPHHDQGELAALASEIRRTQLAARRHMGDSTIERVILCSDHGEELGKPLESTVSIPVEVFDPIADCRVSSQVQLERVATFAPVIGLLTDELHGTRHEIDFLRPRRPAPPPDRRPFYMTLATIALVAILLLALGIWWQLGAMDRKIKSLSKESLSLDKTVETARRQAEDVADLEDWEDGAVNWLIEVRDLSERLPQADRVRIDNILADLNVQSGGGVLTVKGYVDQPTTLAEFESSMTDENHETDRTDHKESGNNPKYPWFFSERIAVKATKMRSVESGSQDSIEEREPSHEDDSMDDGRNAARPNVGRRGPLSR